MVAKENGKIVGICQAILVPARRGRHLSVPYGPLVSEESAVPAFLEKLKEIAREQRCWFVRFSPFWTNSSTNHALIQNLQVRPSPLHLLSEYVWYIPLTKPSRWPYLREEGTNDIVTDNPTAPQPRTEEELLADMRKTTRNLIRRAEKEGVTVRASTDPLNDLEKFITLHEETRKRHGFTPYTNAFFRAQVKHFSQRNECTLYLAEYQGEVIASSVHMHVFGETSYHHGASTHAHAKIPASYLLQWTAIRDALKRGDDTYSFWGIAPEGQTKHPFAGVRTFKMGFGGKALPLVHCMDAVLDWRYHATRAFEIIRKHRRGF